VAVALRATAYPAGVNLTTINVVIPATVQAGDQMLIVWTTAGSGTTTDPSGWTRLGLSQGTSTNLVQILLARTAVGGDAGTTVPLILGPSNSSQGAFLHAYFDDTTGSVTVDGAAFRTGAGMSTPALTTSVANCAVMAAASVRASSGVDTDTWTVPSGYTQLGSGFNAGGAGKAWVGAHNLTPVASGSSVGGATFASSGAEANNCTLTVALRPGGAGGGGSAGAAAMRSRSHFSGGGFPKVANLQTPAFAMHRGGLGEGPSETLGAYNHSMPLDPWYLAECDCQMNASGSIVLWHDPTLADGVTTVASQTDAQWNTVTVPWPTGFPGTPDPYPAAYWSDLADAWGGIRLLIPEMKDSGAVDIPLMNDIRARGLIGSTIIQCFDVNRAKAAAAAGFNAMALYGVGASPNFADLAANGVLFAGMDSTTVTSAVVASAHASGVQVWPYVVNSAGSRDSFLAFDTDGFFTNFPSTVPIPGTGTLAGQVTVQKGGVASLTSHSSFGGTGAVTARPTAAMTSASSLAAAATGGSGFSAVLTSASTLAATVSSTFQPTAALVSHSILTAGITSGGTALTASADAANLPPRVLLSLSGSAGATATIVRIDQDGNSTPVRTANPATLAGGAWLGYDYEAPYGQPVTYVSTPNTGPALTSNPVTLNVTVPWLIHPGIPSLSQPLTVVTIGTRTRTVNQGVFTVLGRPNAVTVNDGARHNPTFPLTIRTAALDDEDALLDLVGDGSALLLQVVYPNITRTRYEWVSVGDMDEDNPIGWFGSDFTQWTLPCTVTDPPTGLQQSQRTLGDLAAEFTTLASIKTAYATLRDISTDTRVGG
jgi:glycerophosphoryl diester phosphodiesterase